MNLFKESERHFNNTNEINFILERQNILAENIQNFSIVLIILLVLFGIIFLSVKLYKTQKIGLIVKVPIGLVIGLISLTILSGSIFNTSVLSLVYGSKQINCYTEDSVINLLSTNVDTTCNKWEKDNDFLKTQGWTVSNKKQQSNITEFLKDFVIRI